MTAEQIDQGLVDKMVEKAIEECARKLYQGDIQKALKALRRGTGETCGAFSDSLVRQISDRLGRLDTMIKAIFEYEPEYATIHPRAHIGSIHAHRQGINLIVWVERKSADLKTFIDTLEKALVESQRKIGLTETSTAYYTLDIKMVDDQDVNERRGYGLIVSSQLVRSTRVWRRDGKEGDDRFATEMPDEVPETAPEWQASVDLELAPASRIINQALEIEKLPLEDRNSLEYYLTDLKVALIRRLISDQLAYIDVAKKWFTISDLADIFNRRIGYGKIGGKSAGMLLAARILKEVADDELKSSFHVPESFFLGSDLIYIFMAMNGLMHWNNQKYKNEDQIYADFPRLKKDFQAGQFPPEVLNELQAILEKIGPKPLIVRSSSQLEDNFGTSFAGKYDSFFCPNQGTAEENLEALSFAVASTYASTLKPDALLYRRRKGLQDYDERMAVLIQAVQGSQFGRYYFPFGAGVAFSRNIYRWSPEIRREDGFARLVWGLGTRAVERVGDDYARMVALSHPTLQPDDFAEAIRRYSQKHIDLLDLEENLLKTMPIEAVLSPRYPQLRLLAQIEGDGYFTTPRMRVREDDIPKTAVTFYELLNRTDFASNLSKMLRILETHYHGAVDIEFTLETPDPRALEPEVKIVLLQCRPQSYLQPEMIISLPQELQPEDTIFSTHFIVPQGYLTDIRHVLFVVPEAYFALGSSAQRVEVGKVISQVNEALPEKSFICIGPGRWGSTNMDLGVFVSYADVYNAGALVELAGKGVGPAPEPSLGTHFFQDLMEAQIYPLAIHLDAKQTIFRRDFFYDSPNKLAEHIPVSDVMRNCIRLIEVASFRAGHHIDLVMDDEEGIGVAYLTPDS